MYKNVEDRRRTNLKAYHKKVSTAKGRAAHAAYMREYWRKASPEALKVRNEKMRAYAKTEAGKASIERRKTQDKVNGVNKAHRHKWKLTDEELIIIWERQDRKCASCKKPGLIAICEGYIKTAPQSLVIDHDHKTGKRRHLLCNTCNKIIGFADDNIEILQATIDYLKSNL